MQALKSKGLVTEKFAWRHYYWYLTNEGIQYLRDYLHLPPEIVPSTLKRQTRPEAARPRPKSQSPMPSCHYVLLDSLYHYMQRSRNGRGPQDSPPKNENLSLNLTRRGSDPL